MADLDDVARELWLAAMKRAAAAMCERCNTIDEPPPIRDDAKFVYFHGKSLCTASEIWDVCIHEMDDYEFGAVATALAAAERAGRIAELEAMECACGECCICTRLHELHGDDLAAHPVAHAADAGGGHDESA